MIIKRRSLGWLPITFAALLLLIITPDTSWGQRLDEVQQATQTFAIQGAEIVTAPGRRIANGTVVIEDGLITAVGRNVTIPGDAEIIEGDGLSVYAGFIDGLSHAGIPAPKGTPTGSAIGPQPAGQRVNRANPDPKTAGIQPDRSAHELIDTKEKSIENLRKAGFTVAHVVPHGNMLPGKGALILLAGDDSNDMVIRRDVSMFAQNKGARRVYPSTPMGVMAKMRQLYKEASRRKALEDRFEANAAGAQRPDYDPVHYALFPVIEGDTPLFIHTTNALEIYRALRLQTELGFPLVLSGLTEGFEYIDLLLDANLPLFATLKLPKPPEQAKDSTEAEPDITSYDPSMHVTDHTATTLERKNLQIRREIFYKEYVSTPASFYAAGLNFGFSSKDVKPEEIHKNLKKMIEHGLPEDVALAALTTNAADALGLSRSMGTIEQGKMANLVVTEGPLFEEDSHVKYVFVDGQKFEYKNEAKDKKSTE